MRELDEATVARINWIRAETKRLKAEEDELWDSLAIDDLGDLPAGRFVVQVTPTRRFDPVMAEQALTSEQFVSILSTKPDGTKAKNLLSPADYTRCQREYGLTKKIVDSEEDK